ncbi:cytochrome P450 [Calycina marina]|uniref:Cytochrome P450 n=1 Tax=Calycina marina TaxID=1763456 RepID=A0A9P8CCG1_9HELO|nr:cytochrome P450 [Calycina marina]
MQNPLPCLNDTTSNCHHLDIGLLMRPSPTLAAFLSTAVLSSFRTLCNNRSLALIMLLASPLLIVYISTWYRFRVQTQGTKSSTAPPIFPYMIPYIGSAVKMATSPSSFVPQCNSQLAGRTVFGIKAFGTNVYIIGGTDNISMIRRYKTSITAPTHVRFILMKIFGMVAEAADIYDIDDSGIHLLPSCHSDVASRKRVDHFTHSTFAKYLGGGSYLTALFNRFTSNFNSRMIDIHFSKNGQDFPDIFDFFMEPLTAALTEATCGPMLECINPNFTKEFLEFLPFCHSFMKGLPKWWIPKAYSLRESLVRDVLQWHAIARRRFQESDVDSDGDADPWWGSKFIRERQKFFLGIDHWNFDSTARSDFGLIWGFALNVHPATIWTIVEVFKDKVLLARVRAELATVNFHGVHAKEDVDLLLGIPLLQSIYAEVLRLRVEVVHLFHSKHEDIQLKEWKIPKSHLSVIETYSAHKNADFWNTRDGQYPLDTFWADRFLIYPNDPSSGPLKKSQRELKSKAAETMSPGKPFFKESGTADSFFPYGIGERTCPGRFFARRAIISVCATIVHDYDIDLLNGRNHFQTNDVFWGTGTQRALTKIPFKIRKRSDMCNV